MLREEQTMRAARGDTSAAMLSASEARACVDRCELDTLHFGFNIRL